MASRRALNVPITADTDGLKRGVREADQELGKLEASSKRTGAALIAHVGESGTRAGVMFKKGIAPMAGLALTAGLAAGAAIGKGIANNLDIEEANTKLRVQLGLTQKESARYGKLAGQLFASNYGDSLGEVNDALKNVVQNIDGMSKASGSRLKGLTGDVIQVSKAFDQDLGGTTRAVGQLMRTGLAKDSQEALNIITKGFQNGADRSGDFLDTLNEYGTQFRNLGIDGKTATGLISQGLKAGARDSDIVADSIKEFGIRAVDGSKTTSDGFKALGLDADKMSEKIAKGGAPAAKGLDQVLDRLRKIKDPVKQSQTAVQLFGTQAEDLGKALYALDPSKAVGGLGKVGGAARKLNTEMGDTAKSKISEFWRTLQQTGTGALAAVTPKLGAAASAATNFIKGMREGSGAGGRFAAQVSDGFVKVKAVAEAVWPVLRDGGKVALDLLSTGFGRMRAIIEAVTPTLMKVRDAAASAFGWLKQNVPPAVEAVKGALSGVGRVASTAFGVVKGAVSSAVQFVRGWLDKHSDDIHAFGQAWKNVAKIVGGIALVIGTVVKEAIEHVLVPVMKVALSVVKTVWPSIKKIIGGVLDVIGGLIQVFSGVFTGDFGRMWDGVKGIFKGGVKVILGIVTGAAKGLLKAATGLGGVMIDGIIAGLKGLGGLLKDAIVGAVKAAATGIPKLIGAALGGLGKAITAGISAGFGKLNPFGDGLGDGLGMSLPGAGLSGGNGLMGAKQIMAPFASMAGRFGLHTSSGARPGAITSSGNVSWHSSGNAIDEAGTPAGMLGYFRFLKNTFGSRLRELIYTPGGIGIKDGRPYQYTGAVAADHYDHVHVAFTGDGHGRKAGTGDGLGRFDATSYGPPWGGIQGGGVTATGVNLKGNPHVYGVAVDPRVIPLGSKLRINPNPFGYSGPFTAFDTGGAIKGNRIDFYDWRGRTAQNGWGHRNVSVSTYSGSGSSGSRGSGGSSIVTSGGSSKPRTGSSGGPPPTVDNKAIYGVTESTVPTFANTFGTPPVKGRGDFPGAPHKGGATLNPDGTDPRQVARDLAAAGPSEFDYLDLALANAEATTGTDDDRSALTAIRDYRARALNAATATGDPRQIAQARRDLTSAESTLNQLVDNTKALTDALTTVGDELKRQTDFAASVQNTSNYQLTKTIADLVSGHIVGRGVAGRAFTPGTGVEVAYAPSVL